jgi:mannose-1-phosphate guanylyltransferase
MLSKNNGPIYGVILAGGFGERLWPMSTEKYPKYCFCIGASRKSLLQQAYERLMVLTAKDRIFVITQRSQIGIIKKQLRGLAEKNIIAEPFRRNTAAAIGLAAIIIGKAAPDAVMVVVPADQFIPDQNAFKVLMENAVTVSRLNNCLLTIGIKPTYPATGYGYIKPDCYGKRYGQDGEDRGQRIEDRECRRYIAYKVKKFVEKPDLKMAKKFIKNGYFWNSGMFVWEVTAILESIRDYMPRLYKALVDIDKALPSNRHCEPNEVRRSNLLAPRILLRSSRHLPPSPKRFRLWLRGTGRWRGSLAMTKEKVYKSLNSVSIDYGVLEKSKKVFVMPANLKWDDVGSWSSMTRMLDADKEGNVIDANFKGMDTKNCIVISKDKKRLVVTFGLKGIIVVQTPIATLICSNKDAEKIKELVDFINRDNKTKGFY